MFNVLRNNDSATSLVCQGVRLVLVRRANELSHWEDCDGIIIDTAIMTEVETIIKTIRLKENIESLTPLFVNSLHHISKELMSHTDGFVDVQQPEEIVHKTIAINKRLAEIVAPSVSNFEAQVTYKFAGFLYSRNQVFTPFVSRASRIGYHFPLLKLYFNDEALNLLKTLEKLENKGYVVKTFKDNIHLCKSCDSTYLNFKEICPSCKSPNIEAHDMIHHFVCAHVAPENDFITEDGLSCPKCDKHLRHIGIDYDKPSAIFSCNGCANEFQNPEMQASCFDCETDNTLSELLQKTIGNYSITAKGEQWLRNTHMPYQKQIVNTALTSEAGLPLPILKILLKQELKRVQKNGVSSQFVTITYENEQIEALNTSMQTALKNEITTIIQSYLASSDVLTVKDYKLYYALLPDTKKAPERVEQIRYNLSKLLTDNLDTDHFVVTVTVQNLDAEMEIDTLFIPRRAS